MERADGDGWAAGHGGVADNDGDTAHWQPGTDSAELFASGDARRSVRRRPFGAKKSAIAALRCRHPESRRSVSVSPAPPGSRRPAPDRSRSLSPF